MPRRFVWTAQDGNGGMTPYGGAMIRPVEQRTWHSTYEKYSPEAVVVEIKSKYYFRSRAWTTWGVRGGGPLPNGCRIQWWGVWPGALGPLTHPEPESSGCIGSPFLPLLSSCGSQLFPLLLSVPTFPTSTA